MKDPVALAYSGRIEEARAAALEQARADDPFLAGQGLEALAVLGEQYGVRADAQMEPLLRRHVEAPDTSRRAFEAAAALQSRAAEAAAVRALESGAAKWETLRYAGEMPSLELARALARGWETLPERLLDQALLVACIVPAADRLEAAHWGTRAARAARHPSEDVRLAAVRAVDVWRPDGAAEQLSRLLEDEVSAVRAAAAQALAGIDGALLAARAQELGEACPEAKPFVPARPPPGRSGPSKPPPRRRGR